MRIVEQNDDEKMAMYMKCTKKELASMLIQCNKHLPSPTITDEACPLFVSNKNNTSIICDNCGKEQWKHTTIGYI